MTNDVIVVIAFVIAVIGTCKLWNFYMMKLYKKSRECGLGMTFGFYINNMEKTKIVGVGSDGNEDYDVAKAIKKTELPDEVRIKL